MQNLQTVLQILDIKILVDDKLQVRDCLVMLIADIILLNYEVSRFGESGW